MIVALLLIPFVGGLLGAATSSVRARRGLVYLTYGLDLAAIAITRSTTAWWHLDALGRYLAVVSAVVGGYVTLFAVRQWTPRRRDRLAQVLVGSVVTLVLSSDLATCVDVLVVSYVLTGLATLALLLVTSPLGRLPRSSVLGLVLGDVALIAAVLVTASASTSLASLHEVSSGAVLMIGASLSALLRSGAGSPRSWVVGTVNNPTAVSALLHAGVVNGGAVLLIRLRPLVSHPTILWDVLVLACVAQLIWWAPLIRRRADLKGQLAASTVSQMTFMVMTLALGWPVLALTHLTGHALYKSTRFMNAAGSIRRRSLTPRTSPPSRGVGVVDLTLGVVVLVSGLVSAVVGGTDVAALDGVLLPGALLLVYRVRRRDPRGAMLLAAVSSLTILAYGAVVTELSRVLDPSTHATLPRAPWWSVGAIVLLVALVVRPRHSRVSVTPLGASPLARSAA